MSTIYGWTTEEIESFLGCHTTIVLDKSDNIQGYLYTIDPNAHHVVLYQHDQKRVQVVLHHAIKELNINPDDRLDLEIMDNSLKYDVNNKYTQEWLEERKKRLIHQFERHRIPIQYNHGEPVIHVLGSARVQSPYVASSVDCDNALIRKRVRDLILHL